MAFPRRPLRVPAPARPRVPVFAVGRRVYVAAGAQGRSADVTLIDDAGKDLTRLHDGTEVTIVAWRPGHSDTTRYRVRVTASGLEGWLALSEIRGSVVMSATVIPSAPPPAFRRAPDRVADVEASGRRFGQRAR